MATVADASGNSPAGYGYTDRKLVTPTRVNAGTPIASLTPAFVGEIVYDTTNGITYRGTGTTANTQWIRTTDTKLQ